MSEKDRTQAEIKRCQNLLDRADISDRDREDSERGLNDWFCESLMEEFEWKPKQQSTCKGSAQAKIHT